MSAREPIPRTCHGLTSGKPTLPVNPYAPVNPHVQHLLRRVATPFWPRAADFLHQEEEEGPLDYMEGQALQEEEHTDSGTDDEVQLLGMYHHTVEQDHTVTHYVHQGHQYLEDQVHRWSNNNNLLPNADQHRMG